MSGSTIGVNDGRIASFAKIEDIEFVKPPTLVYLRDVYDHVVRINESTENVRELLSSALEANLSLTSIRQWPSAVR